jgi:DNA-binding HxlR family transcriptional regulator
MTVRRYNQYCGVARALDVVGERWSLLIVRDLLDGPRRYSDLLHGLAGIPTDVLASRLRHLESAGVVRRTTLPPPAGSKVYELTERGRELESVIVDLSRWGTDLLGEPTADDSFHAAWLGLSLRSRFRPERAGGVELTANIEVDGDTLRVEIANGTLTTDAGQADSPDVVIVGDAAALAAAARGEPIAGRLAVSGQRSAIARFAAVFGIPDAPAGPVQAPVSPTATSPRQG